MDEEWVRRYGDLLRGRLWRFGVPPGELDDALQDLWILAAERVAAGQGPTDGQVLKWLDTLAYQVWSRHHRAFEYAVIALPSVSLDAPIQEDSELTRHDLIAGGQDPAAVVVALDTIKLIAAIAREEPGRETLAGRLALARRLVAVGLIEPGARIVVGGCRACYAPIFQMASGVPIPHACPGTWKLQRPVLVADTPERRAAAQRRGQRCVVCGGPTLRGRLACPRHRTALRGINAPSQPATGEERYLHHACAWCKSRLARANRPFCGRECANAYLTARKLSVSSAPDRRRTRPGGTPPPTPALASVGR